jgi:HD-like signal output (HDOD) protein/ActR/RegA family two-component response regulator
MVRTFESEAERGTNFYGSTFPRRRNGAGMKRILFVDDEPRVLDGLQRMLYSFRNDWEMVFAGSGREALEKLAGSHFDVLITDVRMPQMSGIQLLAEVVERYPEVVRMVLSGQYRQEMTLSSVTLAHQYIAKPCDAQQLRLALDRALNLRLLLDNPALKQVISRIRSVPSLPRIYTQLMQAIQSPDATPEEIGRIIAQDLGMSAKVLQLVNSSFFGIQRRITSPAAAVVYLGTETIRALALTVSVFSEFDTARVPSFSLEKLSNHGILVGSLARQITSSLGLSNAEVEDTFLAGLLHELGRLVLASNYPEEYESAIRRTQADEMTLDQAEQQVFGTTHAPVGAYLLWLWGLPGSAAEIVAHYAQPGSGPHHATLAAVHVAAALAKKQAEQNIDLEYLDEMGFAHHLPEWRQLRDRVTETV